MSGALPIILVLEWMVPMNGTFPRYVIAAMQYAPRRDIASHVYLVQHTLRPSEYLVVRVALSRPPAILSMADIVRVVTWQELPY